MGRLPRVYVENALYYVTSKGGHGQDTFIDEADYREYINLIDRYKKQYGFKLYSYALLPTHLHLLIELNESVNISSIMHDINSLYTKMFNGKYNRKGHLFQSRFKAVIAEKTANLLPLTRHIHRNSIRVGISDDPKDYPFSSHIQYVDPLKNRPPEITDEIHEVFNLFSSAQSSREDAFEEYVTHPRLSELNAYQRTFRKKRIIGSKEFIDHVHKIIEKNQNEKQKPGRTRKTVRVFMALSGTAVLTLAVVIGYFQNQNTELRGEYGKTLIVYENTLEMLERERDRALRTDEDIKEYLWKIRLTEQTLADIKAEQDAERVLAKEELKVLEGYSWKIDITQTGGPKMDFVSAGAITIKDFKVHSTNMMREGFKASKYSKRELADGRVIWETIQRNEKGETANWHGEWNGKTMRGNLRRTWTNGVVRDFTFKSLDERIPVRK
ncbi:transposase [PVC group bacterium]|nr:transposase [PVC group bacterium]